MSAVLDLLEELTGQTAPFSRDFIEGDLLVNFAESGIGRSQFNELLLLLGYDRVTESFFQFLVDGTARYIPGSAFRSEAELQEGVDRFRKLAMLRFGNIKFAFKVYSELGESELNEQLTLVERIPDELYTARHDPVLPIERIDGDDTYYLGYIVQNEIEQRLKADPNSKAAIAEKEKLNRVLAKGKRNHEAYLASDHMDVYVATSMRDKHEYFIVNRISDKVFADKRLVDLRLRYFDPTQAYCSDRIDKGLAEALMLKRAKCTLYLAQESDTLGKDSELASTLAQGKPVVAFVPRIESKNDIQWLIGAARKMYPGRQLEALMRQQFRLFAPDLAWSDDWVKEWIREPKSKSVAEVEDRLFDIVRSHYDKRANLFKEIHPLGIQVNLDTGVANGVLVARTTAECSELIYRIVTNQLEFEIKPKIVDGQRYLLLCESTSGSVFRVVSGDRLLTNAFWNFYLS